VCALSLRCCVFSPGQGPEGALSKAPCPNPPPQGAFCLFKRRPPAQAALPRRPGGVGWVVLRYDRAASGTRVKGCSCRRAKATNTNRAYAKWLGRSVHKRALQPNERACACSLVISHVHPQVAFDLGRARLCLSSGVLPDPSDWVRESGDG